MAAISHQEIIRAFRQTFDRDPAILVCAPGRVNLLGAHVDYHEGWVLPATVDRAMWLAASPTDVPQVRIRALDFDELGEISLASLSQSPPAEFIRDLPYGWMKYPSGVAWAMLRNGLHLKNIDTVFIGDIPIGAGVSSSAAVEVAFILAWEALSGLQLDNLARARMGQVAENEFLGVASGIMDQFACLHGQANKLILLDCRTLEHELVSFPAEAAIVIADSGVRRELGSSEYNLRRRQGLEALDILRNHLPEIHTLRDVSVEQFAAHERELPEIPRRRARHVIEECARVHQGVAALRRGDLTWFGQLIKRSHLSSRELYGVSIEELDTLASTAWQTPGCYGARLTGGGFGGCVAALVDTSATEEVKAAMSEAFSARFGCQPVTFTCHVGAGAQLHHFGG